MPPLYEGVEFAWACGLFEGEGSVVNRENRYTHYERGPSVARNRGLCLSTTDRDVLERFCRIVGVGKIGPQRVRPGCKPLFRWTVSRWCEVQPLAAAMLPLMGDRRATAIRALLANPPKARSNARLTDREVDELRGRALAGEGCRRLASEYGVSQGYASRLINDLRRAAPSH